MNFPGVSPPDYLIDQNDCRPANPDDPGFALLTTDAWYAAHPNNQQYTARYSNNHAKRGEWFDPDQIVYDDGNSTRRPTEEELEAHFGLRKCATSDCAAEMEELGLASARVMAPPFSKPAGAVGASATAESSTIASAQPTTIASVTGSRSGSENVLSASEPRQTGSVVAEKLKELLEKM